MVVVCIGWFKITLKIIRDIQQKTLKRFILCAEIKAYYICWFNFKPITYKCTSRWEGILCGTHTIDWWIAGPKQKRRKKLFNINLWCRAVDMVFYLTINQRSIFDWEVNDYITIHPTGQRGWPYNQPWSVGMSGCFVLSCSRYGCLLSTTPFNRNK